MIGNSLLILFAEKQNWQAGYQIICHMVSFNIEYLKYCGAKREIAVVAMETCLQCLQPDSALQILKGSFKLRKTICLFKLKMKLTHISLASLFWDLSKQCRPRSDAAIRVYPVCLQEFLFKKNKNEKVHQTPLK